LFIHLKSISFHLYINIIKNKWLLSKQTHYGLELSLNIDKKKEIEEFIDETLVLKNINK